MNIMKRNLLTLLLVLLGTAGFCVTHTITNAGMTFSPASININSGDSVKFNLGNIHNAVEVTKDIWDANGNTHVSGFSVPYGGGLVLPEQLTVGTHYYVCTPHAALGMKGVIIVQGSTGIADNTLKTNISIYPNPSNGEFQLDIGSSQNVTNYNLNIYNLHGDRVYATSELKQQNSYKIDLSGLPKGFYFVKINEGALLYYRKIVFQ
jgi:plastocyanin